MESILSQNITSLRTSSIFARKASINLRSVVTKKRISSQKLFADEKRVTYIFDQRRKRQKREELLEANKIKSLSSGSVSYLANKGKGFLGRIMGAIGSLFLGWLIQNYPIIRDNVIRLKEKIDSITGSAKKFLEDSFQILKPIKDFAVESFAYVRQNFDFESVKGSMEIVANNLENKFIELRDSFSDTYDWVKENLPKTIFEYLGIQLPGVTEQPEEPEEPVYYGPGGDPSGSGRGQAQQRPQQPQQPEQLSKKDPDLWTLVAISALEDSDPQGRADVAQSIYNRKRAGAKFGYRGGSIKGLILEGNGKQYQPVERAVREFRAIEDREGAIKALMKADNLSREVAAREIDATLSALTNKTLQRNARAWVQGRTDFYGKSLTPPESATEIRQRNANDNKFGNFVGPGSKRYAQTGRNRYIAAQPPAGISSRPEKFYGAPVSGNTGSSVGNRPARTSVSISNSPFMPGETGGAQIVSAMGTRNGRQHQGVDIAANRGTGLYAYLPGKITQNKFDPGYGNLVEWRDSVYNQLHLFSHMMSPSPLQVGERFNAGDLLGQVGSTGRSEGPHLHWEIGPAGKQVDPIDWVKTHLGKEIGYLGPTMETKEGGSTTIITPPSPQSEMIASGPSSGTVIGGSEEDVLNRIMNIRLAYV